jgi:two-component system, OmpR family, sensor histidine kinase KdpD
VPNIDATRRDPEQLLRQLQAEEEHQRRGRLKIFLGYTSGVGKSFRMLDEGRRRHARGEDVVVGAIQPVHSCDVHRLLETMEVIPLKGSDGAQAMDLDLILSRHPEVCLVDGLAYDNPPGSRSSKRWQDVEYLLEAGISVISTVNLQYIEELGEQVEKITGRRPPETIPLSFMHRADEIEVVDAPPEHCLERTTNATSEEIATTQQKLSGLRELALLLAADVVDRQLENYLEQHGLQQLWGAQERVLVCVTSRFDATRMLESGRRNADRFHGELFVAYVNEPDVNSAERGILESNLAVARRLNARIDLLDGDDPIDTIMNFARTHGITQIFIGHSSHESWWHRLRGSFVDRMIREAEGIDVRVFPR